MNWGWSLYMNWESHSQQKPVSCQPIGSIDFSYLCSLGLPIEKTCVELTPKLPPFWRSELTNAASRPQLISPAGDFSQGGDSTDVFFSIGESHWISSIFCEMWGYQPRISLAFDWMMSLGKAKWMDGNRFWWRWGSQASVDPCLPGTTVKFWGKT